MKQILILALRKYKLLHIAESFKSKYSYLMGRKKINKFKKEYPNFILPPWNISYDAYAGLDPYKYYELGFNHASIISQYVKNFVAPSSGQMVICDWGCGPMRVLRHLPLLIGQSNYYVGLDFNPDTVKWASANFQNIKFLNNNLSPPLPLESESVDVIYNISVFTHLSKEMFLAYVDELSRVLKKGGLLIATLHGDRNSKNLLPFELIRYKNGEFVARDNVKEGKRIFISYHPTDFVLNAFNSFEVLAHNQDTVSNDFMQDWWVFRKN